MYENDDPMYAQQRLMGTIIRYEGKAVEVGNVVAEMDPLRPLQVISTVISTGKVVKDSIDKYDLTPVKLGFVNYPHSHVSYLERKPMRNDWRQGLRQNNSIFMEKDDVLGRLWAPKQIAKTIENEFPSLEASRNALKEEPGKIAWHRHFAIDNEDNIFYRTVGKVGNFIENGKNFLLDNKFIWVEERLREALK